MLTDEQVERYSRQIILPRVGGRGQEALLSAAVAVIGTGPATEAASLYLAAAGMGTLVLVGEDAARAAAEVAALNPDCRARSVPLLRHADGFREVVDGCTVLVVTNVDQPTHTLLDGLCRDARTPLVWGGVDRGVGWATTVCGPADNSPCLQCLHPLSAARAHDQHHGAALDELTAAFVGTQQALEAICLVLGCGTTLSGRLLTYDAFDGSVRTVAVTRDPQCGACNAALWEQRTGTHPSGD